MWILQEKALTFSGISRFIEKKNPCEVVGV